MKYMVAFITFLLGLSIWGVVYFNILRHDEMYDQIEVRNQTFKIRITAYTEKGVLLPGVYFVLRSAPVNSDQWKDVLAVHGDEPIPLRREQLGLVTDRTGYGFIGTHYLLTTNAGNDWSSWDAEKHLPDDEYQRTNRARYIEEVQILPDGNGRLRLGRFSSERERGPDLFTSNYGLHWQSKE